MATIRIGQHKKELFLAAYRKTGSITAAAAAASCKRQAHYFWLTQDPKYKTAFEAAEDEAVNSLEDEARRRAKEGWMEPVYYKGTVCGAIRKFSDTLLIFLLKGAKPEKYRDRYEMTGKDGGPIEHNIRVEFIDRTNS